MLIIGLVASALVLYLILTTDSPFDDTEPQDWRDGSR
jgi:hypothetical protein